MKRLTEEQQSVRDKELDWEIAKHFRHALSKDIWDDFSPTSDWNEAGRLIEQYQIDIRWFNPETNTTLSGPWMAGLMAKNKHGLQEYFTAFADTPLIAAMKALISTI